MSTTISSLVVFDIDVIKLKKELENGVGAGGEVTVLEIRPGISPSTATEVDLIQIPSGDDLTATQISDAQSILDSHIDQKVENLLLSGRNEIKLKTAISGNIFINNSSDVWVFADDNHFKPLANISYDIGDNTLRVRKIWGLDADFTGDVQISGNLDVLGSTTTLDTTNLSIEDNQITLNKNFTTGSPTLDGGIEFLRGDDPTAQVLWNETTDRWEVGIVGSMDSIALDTDLSNHIGNTSNPHSVTSTQVGLGNVTNDAQLKRDGGDFSAFTQKTPTIVGADQFIIEDSADSFNKKYITFTDLTSSLVHQDLSGAGTNDHAAIDSHISNTSNPHSVTSTQVGLGNVTNDAQLKRSADDWALFTSKSSLNISDRFILEDFDSLFVKKRTTLYDISQFIDGYSISGAPSDGQGLSFNTTLSVWEYNDFGDASSLRGIPIETGLPNPGDFLIYNDTSGEAEWSDTIPGIGSSGPIGSIIAFSALTPPTGFLICDGSEVSRTGYSDLFAVIGTTYGVGDGSTTFNLPDLRQRFILGKADSGTGSVLASTGGAIDHTHTGGAHDHSLSSHTHDVISGSGTISVNTPGSTTLDVSGPDINVTGSGGAVDTSSNNPPYMSLVYIIKFSDNILTTGTQEISGEKLFTDCVKYKTHSDYNFSEMVQCTAAITTTDATEQILATVTPPDPSMTWFEMKLCARLDGASPTKHFWATINGGIRRHTSGNAELVGTPFVAFDDEGASGYSVVLDVSGTDIQVKVTGGSGETVYWVGTYNYQSVVTNL